MVDFTAYFGAPHSLSSHQHWRSNTSLNKKSPFEENINLKESNEFVKSLPILMGNNNNNINQQMLLNIDVSSAQRRRRRSNNEANNNSLLLTKKNLLLEGPSTPGRPIFSFSSGNVVNKKCFPSKWDDAEKWLNGSNSCNHSPAHNNNNNNFNQNGFKVKPQVEVFAEKPRVTLSKGISCTQDSSSLEAHSASSEVLLLKDKFTNEAEPISPKFRCSDSTKEAFFFGNLVENPIKNAVEVADVAKHRDIGTQMTPLGSSTTSRYPTPFMSTSPIRNNTPASRSGPLALMGSDYNDSIINFGRLEECHLAKLKTRSQFDSVGSAWSSREEEEEEISTSLRYFEFSNEFQKSVSGNKGCKWEEEENNKCCLRYQREEARIQAWVNLQNAKAEAQSKKLEVKIQKMRSDLEEKLMKRMAVVHRKAEEWRADAEFQHSNQIQKATKQAHKILHLHNSKFSSHKSTCFPCNSHIYSLEN